MIEVKHKTWGIGHLIPTMHAEEDAEGKIAWHDVFFEHGIEREVPTTDLDFINENDDDFNHIVHFVKGNRVGARSMRSVHVNAKDHSEAIDKAKKYFPNHRKEGYRIDSVKVMGGHLLHMGEDVDYTGTSIEESLIDLDLEEGVNPYFKKGTVTIDKPGHKMRQELLSGIREKGQFERLRSDLRAFDDVPLTTEDYEEAATACNRCRAHGITGSAIDFHLCAVAMRREWALFTTDADFTRYARHLPLRLHRPR